MAISYHDKPKKRLTIRQAARVSAEKTINGILEAFDQVNASKKKVIEPIMAEMDTTIELLQNRKKSPEVFESECVKIDEEIENINRLKAEALEVRKAINIALVELNKITEAASAHTDTIIAKVKEGVPKDGTHSAYKDELLFLEVEHTTMLDKAIEVVSASLVPVQTLTVGWSKVANRLEDTE